MFSSILEKKRACSRPGPLKKCCVVKGNLEFGAGPSGLPRTSTVPADSTVDKSKLPRTLPGSFNGIYHVRAITLVNTDCVVELGIIHSTLMTMAMSHAGLRCTTKLGVSPPSPKHLLKRLKSSTCVSSPLSFRVRCRAPFRCCRCSARTRVVVNQVASISSVVLLVLVPAIRIVRLRATSFVPGAFVAVGKTSVRTSFLESFVVMTAFVPSG